MTHGRNILIICLVAFFITLGIISNAGAETYQDLRGSGSIQYGDDGGLNPAEEQLDQVSEPIGEISEPLVDTPTEPLDTVSETTGELSEPVGELTEEPEPLGEDSESIDRLGENLDQVSEPVGEASENLPIAPEGDGSDMEYTTDEAQMPLGDREAEGRGIGDY